MMDESLRNARREFTENVLLESDLPGSAVDLLLKWYQEAVARGIPDANAMSLATIDKDGYPASRIVLLRDASAAGLSFFTNYHSAKGRELERTPKASLEFFWQAMERQVRVRGSVEKISAAESDAYFASRPRESQIGAWASRQSEVISSRGVLDRAVAHYQELYKTGSVPRPPHWGGYRLVPDVMEFWQGRPSRLHDRMRAIRNGDQWLWERLSP